MPDSVESDVIIIGAGPAGLATALGLANSGLSVTLIDKDSFPRDKVCGGGLGSRSLRVLNDLMPGESSVIASLPIRGFTVTTPDLREYLYQPEAGIDGSMLGATIHRADFDAILLASVLKNTATKFYRNTEAEKIEFDDAGVTVETNSGSIRGKILAIADGAHSQLIGQVTIDPFDRSVDAIAIRGIFKDVLPDPTGDLVNFYFFKDVFPGYFWLFPLPNNLWNAGIYIPLRFKHQKSHNLNRLFFDLIQENSTLAGRFQDAVLTGRIESDVLPLAKISRKYSGHRWLSAGDAASLVDPLAGEGIANALMSGQLAANHIVKAFEASDFSAKFNREYDEILMLKLKKEFTTRHRLIRFFGNKPVMFNILFSRLANSFLFQRLIIKMLYNQKVNGRLRLKE